MAYVKYFETITNARGDSLPDYRVQVVDSLGAVVDIFRDKSGTRFTEIDGTTINYATAGPSGKAEFYWEPATGQVLQVLDGSGDLVDTTVDFADGYVIGNLPGSISQAAVTDLTDDLAAKAATADLASTADNKGGGLIALSQAAAYAVGTEGDRFKKQLFVTDAPFSAVGDGSTNNDTAITAAVANALLTGRDLRSPEGGYLTTASIANFHDVNHAGTGRIIRGSDTWYINPTSYSQKNVLYVRSGGNDANDGLSASQPLATLQRAADILEKYVSGSNGQWEINVGSGTFARIRFPDEGMPTVFPVRIIGDPVSISAGFSVAILTENRTGTFTVGETLTCSVSGATITVTSIQTNLLIGTIATGTPAFGQTITGGTSGATATIGYISPRPRTLIKEGATQSAFGIRTFADTSIYVKDILLEDFNGSTSSSGIYSNSRARVFCENVHFEDCYLGISANEWCEIDVKGGVFNDCGYLNSSTGSGYAIRGLFHAKLSVGTQSAGNLQNGPLFTNNYIGVFGQEHCDGHVDWCLFRDNVFATRPLILSRFNVGGSSFKRNTHAMFATDAGLISADSNTELGTGTDKNGTNYIASGGSGTTSSPMFTGDNVGSASFASTSKCIHKSAPNQTVNSTSAVTLNTTTLLGQKFVDTNTSITVPKKFSFKITGNLTGTTDIKRITIRCGAGFTNVTFASSDVGTFKVEGFVLLPEPGRQIIHIDGYRHLSLSPRLGRAIGTEALTSDTNITLQAEVGDAADSILIDTIETYMEGV